MKVEDTQGAGPAACAILQALLDELVKSNILTQDKVDNIFAAAGSTLADGADLQVFGAAGRVLAEMQALLNRPR